MFWARLLNLPIIIWLFCAALILFGSTAALDLPVRSSPVIPYRYVDISTNLSGGDVLTIDRFVTLPLEKQVEQVPGIKYVTGFTMTGNSDINAFLADGASPNTVYSQVLAAEDSVRANLPSDVQAPTIKLVGDPSDNGEFSIAVMVPSGATAAAVTAYINSDLIGRLSTVPGIGPISLYSGMPKLRIDFDPRQMIAQNITPVSLASTLDDVGVISPTGVLRNDSAMMPVVSEAGFAAPLPAFALGAHRALIDEAFSAPDVQEILRRLEAEGGDFAKATIAALRAHSPLSIAWSFQIIRQGAARDMRACLAAELALVRRVALHPEFHEGVRAVLVDKDRQPKWQVGRLEEVDQAAIACMFF